MLLFSIKTAEADAENFLRGAADRKVAADKVFAVRFNDIIHKGNLQPGNIRVVGEEGDVNISIENGADGKTLILRPPAEGYLPGKIYSLIIQELTNDTGKTLKSPVQMSFEIEEAENSSPGSVLLNENTEGAQNEDQTPETSDINKEEDRISLTSDPSTLPSNTVEETPSESKDPISLDPKAPEAPPQISPAPSEPLTPGNLPVPSSTPSEEGAKKVLAHLTSGINKNAVQYVAEICSTGGWNRMNPIFGPI